MELINLTQHAINIVDKSGEIVRTYEPSGTVARVNQKDIHTGHYAQGTPIVAPVYGETVGLPRESGNMYIVSMVVALANSHRDDLICPNTGPTARRDEKGHIVGVINFVSYAEEMKAKAYDNYKKFEAKALEDIVFFDNEVRRLEAMDNPDTELIESAKRQIESLRAYLT